MLTVGLGVGRVVEAVGPARRQTEGDEGHEGLDQLGGVVQHPGRTGGGEDEHVLRPLPRPEQANHGRDVAGRAPGLGCTLLSATHAR